MDIFVPVLQSLGTLSSSAQAGPRRNFFNVNNYSCTAFIRKLVWVDMSKMLKLEKKIFKKAHIAASINTSFYRVVVNS